MAREQGIRVWRYDQAGKSWTYHSNRHPDLTLPAAKVSLPERSRHVSDGDFLFEDLTGVANPDAIDRIPRNRVLGVAPIRLIPDGSDVWFWDGDESLDGLHRIYVRRGTREERSERAAEQRAQIRAALPDDALGTRTGHIIILQSETKAIVFRKDRGHEEVELDVEEGRIDLGSGGPGDFDHAQVLSVLSVHLNRNRQKLLAAFQSEDPATAAAAVYEFIKGATPSPTQGSNVVHSLPSVIDDIAKLRQVVQCNVDEAKAEGVTGGFGQGVGVVDLGWQSLGSILTYFSDVCHAATVSATSKEQRGDRFGANAQLRAGTSVLTSYSKSVGTFAKAMDGINQVANSASSITSLAATSSGVGAVTGVITMCRSFHQVRKADKRRRAMNAMKRLARASADDTGKALVLRTETSDLLAYATAKVTRKQAVKTYEGAVAGVGAVGATILVVAGTVAAANAWNPIGWGIGIAAFIAGAGMLAYKIYRRRTKKAIARKDFPRMLVARYLHLRRHHQPGGLRSARTKSRRELEIQVLEGMLLSYGVDPYRCFFIKEVPLLEARIARHLKS